MPTQETFLEESFAGRTLRVVKTYDAHFAHEAFDEMDSEALRLLSVTLDLEGTFDASDIPASDNPAYPEFIWDELLGQAREDGNLLSFFIVTETLDRTVRSLYVSPDWPSAEAFVRKRTKDLV